MKKNLKYLVWFLVLLIIFVSVLTVYLAFKTKNQEPISFNLSNSNISVQNKLENFNYTVSDFMQMSAECNTNKTIEYYEDLVLDFKDAQKNVYYFSRPEQQGGQNSFIATLLPNKINYQNMEQFEQDFGICEAGAKMYPADLNKKWLLFVSSCGTGFADTGTGGQSNGCQTVKDVVMQNLKLN